MDSNSSYVLINHILNDAEWAVFSKGWKSCLELKGESGDTYIKGNVGIGTNVPYGILHINNATNLVYSARPLSSSLHGSVIINGGKHLYRTSGTNGATYNNHDPMPLLSLVRPGFQYSSSNSNGIHNAEVVFSVRQSHTYYADANAQLDIEISRSTGGSRNTVMSMRGSNGNVGIGTTSPSYKLDVNGSARFTGNLTVQGTLTYNSYTNNTYNGTATFYPNVVTALDITSINLSTSTYTYFRITRPNIKWWRFTFYKWFRQN